MKIPMDCTTCPFTSRCMTYYQSQNCHFYQPKKENKVVKFVKQIFGKIFN